MKSSMCLRNHSHRVFSFSAIMPIDVFSVPTERAAVTAGGDLRGLGTCCQQALLATRQNVFVTLSCKLLNFEKYIDMVSEMAYTAYSDTVSE